MKKLLNQSGSIHTLPLLLIIAAVGIISFLLITSTAPIGGLFGTINPKSLSHASSGCVLSNGVTPTFCETFDNPAPLSLRNRSGQLDGTLWGTSRIEGGMTASSNDLDSASPSTMDNCGTSYTAEPGTTDVIICNGQMRESSYDEHGVSSLAIYAKQPFDFANRTGIISFDVSNDTTGSHGAWPEFWITDQPVPAPFTHGGSASITGSCDLCSVPRNAVGIDLSGGISANQGFSGDCPTDNTVRWTVAGFKIVRNYVLQESDLFSTDTNFQSFGCVKESSGPDDALNHVEIRISQNQIEVWATNPGDSVLHHLTTYTNANLSFTRGVVWLEDAHYNAEKAADKTFDPNNPTPNLANHTFTWDNVAFDGPATYRDVSLDVLDSLQNTGRATNSDAGVTGNLINLGWATTPTSPVTLTTVSGFTQTNIDTGTAANKGAYLMFNMGDMGIGDADTINYTINGHAHTFTLPFSLLSTQGPGVPAAYHSIALPVPYTDLVTGPQQVQLSANVPMIVVNVNVVLLAAAPVPGVTPGPSSILSPTPVPTPASTPAPSTTATPSGCPKASLGDVNCDGLISIFDYSILVGNYNKSGTGIQGDLNGDGTVNIFDYNLLLTNFGK